MKIKEIRAMLNDGSVWHYYVNLPVDTEYIQIYTAMIEYLKADNVLDQWDHNTMTIITGL